MLLITLLALGAAVAAWLRPLSDATARNAPTFTDKQVADAKANVCAAYQKVQRASYMNSTRTGGVDPNAQLLVAVNGRQVFIVGSEYLLTTLHDEPATPYDLAAEVRKLANLFQILAVDGLASDPSIPSEKAANETGTTIESLCK